MVRLGLIPGGLLLLAFQSRIPPSPLVEVFLADLVARDTLTIPTDSMFEAMNRASRGDDVYDVSEQ